jgi:hypothetical protein
MPYQEEIPQYRKCQKCNSGYLAGGQGRHSNHCLCPKCNDAARGELQAKLEDERLQEIERFWS